MNTNEVLNKLKAEIERRRVLFEYNGKTPDERTWRCLGELIFFIDSLQQEQPEVDLEKEIDKAMKSDLCPEEISDYDFCRIARHFYELGKNNK